MCLVVNKGLKLELLPSKSMIQVLEQNIGNARFYMEQYPWHIL